MVMEWSLVALYHKIHMIDKKQKVISDQDFQFNLSKLHNYFGWSFGDVL